MPAFTASAPGKIILAGEHAVVYGQPALAVPVPGIRTRAVVQGKPGRKSGEVAIQAPAVDLDHVLDELDPEHPIRWVVDLVKKELDIPRLPALNLRINSEIPVGAGLGSSAAVSVAVIRALSAFLGHPLPDEKVSALAYQAEKVHHGNPSGIDNTVITYQQPVLYQKGSPVRIIQIPASFTLIIGDTGKTSLTSETVEAVRQAWKEDPERYEALFDQIGALVGTMQRDLENGDLAGVGQQLTANHRLLQELDVSSPELDRLVEASLDAGALGAKLSGGGRGGNMIALVRAGQQDAVVGSLQEAGAAGILVSVVRGSTED